jgi:hypothetical protein
MSTTKDAIETANHFLNKAADFKYFALLGAFILVLDSALVAYYDLPLLKLTVGEVNDKVSVGACLIFLAIFTLFVSFVVSAIKYILIVLFSLLPVSCSNFFNSKGSFSLDKNHYVDESKLLKYSIEKDNQVAYSVYKSRQDVKNSDQFLEHFSLAFLLASLLNIVVATKGDGIVLGFLLNIDTNAGVFSTESMIFSFSLILYACLFYLGVMRGCGLIYSSSDHFYMYNHGIKFDE